MIPKFRIYCYETQEMIVARDYRELAELFAGLDADDSIYSEPMQSTRLFDKNSKEIFEGDIVVNQYGSVGYVAYLKQEAGFVVVLKKSDYRLGHRNTGESYDVTNDHEIIGNIYQNKELVAGME